MYKIYNVYKCGCILCIRDDDEHETCKLVLQILLHTHTHWLYYKVSDEYAELGFLYIGERFLLRGPVVFVISSVSSFRVRTRAQETKHIFSFSLFILYMYI